MKFAHMGDCHLGGWRQPELNELNFASFRIALERCIKEKVDFILITGDLFDTAYPPIETLKDAFYEFRKVKEAGISVFLIAGSHDYSVSGKSFLDVLEKAGLCKNVAVYEERDGKLILQPTIYKNIALYGYPGKKSGMEVFELEHMKLDDAPGFFKILLLHTAIRDAVGTLPIDAVDHTQLPKVDYLALSHLHINYCKQGRVYSGPLFPNNLSELEELQGGSFYIFDNGKITRQEIKIKPVVVLDIEIRNALRATEDIAALLQTQAVTDALVVIKLSGILDQGKISDIDFARIEEAARKYGAYAVLKSTTKLHLATTDLVHESVDPQHLETEIIKQFEQKNPGRFNHLIPGLLKTLQIDKAEDEKSLTFEERLFTESRRMLFP